MVSIRFLGRKHCTFFLSDVLWVCPTLEFLGYSLSTNLQQMTLLRAPADNYLANSKLLWVLDVIHDWSPRLVKCEIFYQKIETKNKAFLLLYRHCLYFIITNISSRLAIIKIEYLFNLNQRKKSEKITSKTIK